MPYDGNIGNQAGLAARFSMFQIPKETVSALIAAEESAALSTLTESQVRYSQLVHLDEPISLAGASLSAEFNVDPNDVASGMVLANQQLSLTSSFEVLSATDTSNSLDVSNYLYHTFQLNLTNVLTALVFQIEGSLDGTNWFNLNASDSPTTANTTKVYGFTFTGKIKNTRLNYVSGDGTINSLYYGGN